MYINFKTKSLVACVDKISPLKSLKKKKKKKVI